MHMIDLLIVGAAIITLAAICWLRYMAKMVVKIGSYPDINAESFGALYASLSSKVGPLDPSQVLAENWSDALGRLARLKSPAQNGLRSFIKHYLIILIMSNQTAKLDTILRQAPPIPADIIREAVREVEASTGESLRDNAYEPLVQLLDSLCPGAVPDTPGMN